MRVVANNLANISTTGYRGEGVIFAEHVTALGPDDPSLSMATAAARETLNAQGALSQTGGAFDLAIEGEGFFLIETPNGERLSRAGAFTPNENGDLVTPEGFRVLDAGGAPVFIPQGAGPVGIAPDGTVSAGGQPVGQVGLVIPLNAMGMVREELLRLAWPPNRLALKSYQTISRI